MKKFLYLIIILALAFPVYNLLSSGKIATAELFGVGIISCLAAYIVAALTRKIEQSRDYKKYQQVHDKWYKRFGESFKRTGMLGIPFMIGISAGAYKADAAQYSESYIAVIALIITVEAITGVMLFSPGSFLPAFYSTAAIALLIIINYLFLNSGFALYAIAILGGFIIWKNNQIKEYMIKN